MTLSYTLHMRLAVPDFLSEPWHGEFAAAMDSIDAAMYNAVIASNTSLWLNSHTYAIGDIVISPVTGQLFTVAVPHTTAASPTTFTAFFAANPTFYISFALTAATQAEAEAGGENTHYMTALRTKQAIAVQAPIPSIASQAEAEAGTDNANMMTALRVKQAIAFQTSAPTTGDIKPTHKVAADTGWIMWVDGTIGNVGSGSSLLAAVTALALFTLYYNSYSDTNCPLLTSAGAGTTRAAQGTAAVAWAALCRMTIPRGPGRSLGISGSGSGLTARTIGQFAGAETETPTIAKTAAHDHANTALSNASPPVINVTLGGGADLKASGTTGSTGSGTALNVLDPTTYVNAMIKL